ncbi:MAG: helix-turn-helix transcriptional regulator [Acidimicrobiales bacterium]
MRADELGDFLRTRRGRLDPRDVGLPVTSNRRTEGLRREEVAVLANIGVSWLTRLEQGRANRVSADVLAGLADALQLSTPERAHLFALAGVAGPPGPVDDLAASPAHRTLVDGLDPNPAYVLDHAWNLAVWNRAQAALFPLLDAQAGPPNLLRLILATPELRTFMTDWAEEVDRLTRQFRLHLTRHPSDEGAALANELRDGYAEFAAAWQRHDVAAFAPQTRCFSHPDLGSLVFDHHRLALPDHPGWTVVIYTPAPDGTTAERFTRLHPGDGRQ